MILLILAVLAGAYFYQALHGELAKLESAHDQAVADTERLEQELGQARERLDQRIYPKRNTEGAYKKCNR